MLKKLKQINNAQLVALVLGVVLILVAYNVVLAITRMGEIKVSINVLPKNAEITVNDKPSSKTVYLTAGDYVFSASAEGWKTDTQKVNISKKDRVVYLLPDPESDAANKFLKDNPEVQLEREGWGGKLAALQSQKATERNPVLSFLPYTNESPPFTIDYGPSKERPGDIFLIISNSSPNGRQAALDWIRQQGQDPADMEIVFPGFVNPLGPEVKRY